MFDGFPFPGNASSSAGSEKRSEVPLEQGRAMRSLSRAMAVRKVTILPVAMISGVCLCQTGDLDP